MTTEVMNPQDVRELQVIVPDWMKKILDEAELQEKRVLVTRQHTPFGIYTTDIVIVEAETKGEGNTPSPLTFNQDDNDALENVEDKIRTHEANRNLNIAKKHGEVMVCQTQIGNVKIQHQDGKYTVAKMPTIQDYIENENAQATVLASGKKSEVLEAVKSIFEIVEG